jgi:ceramide glucosyltransferase
VWTAIEWLLAAVAFAFAAVAFASFALHALGIRAVLRHRRRAAAAEPPTYPPVSVLKPLKGLEEDLERNLRSFFALDYPGSLEIVFATSEADDPAFALARRLAAEYPKVRARFVVSDPSFGLNPKVATLAGALRAATHDLVVQSDANTRVPPNYLRRTVAELIANDASLLSSLIVGVGERSIGAAFENLQLNAFTAPGVCVALDVADIHCVIGKSMLFRRSELAEVGGLELVRDVLAEDFVLGREFQRLGKKVLLSAAPVENVNQSIGIDRFLARHSRWLKMRAAIHLGGFLADLGSNPVSLLVIAAILSGFDLVFVAMLGAALPVKLGLDAFYIRAIRGHTMPVRYLVLAPIKDLLLGATWFYAIFSRSVRWRGVKLRFGKDSRLRPDDGALPSRVLRRLIGAGL